MKNRNTITTTFALAALAMLLFVSAAPAAILEQEQAFSGNPNFLRTLTFDKFDDQGGLATLNSIEYIFTLDNTGGILVLDNDGEQPASGNYEFGTKASLMSFDVPMVNALSMPVTGVLTAYNTGTFSLAADVGDSSGDWDPSGPDGIQIDGTIQSDSDSGFINATAFSQYTGTGTFDVLASANQWFDFEGVSGVEGATTPSSVAGSVKILYNYAGGTPVPEPATMILFGSGLMGLGAIGRRRKGKG